MTTYVTIILSHNCFRKAIDWFCLFCDNVLESKGDFMIMKRKSAKEVKRLTPPNHKLHLVMGLIVVLTSATVTLAQTPGPSGAWTATPIDGSSTLWQRQDMVTNTATGAIERKLRHYTEIGGGLNYVSADGSLLRSATSSRSRPIPAAPPPCKAHCLPGSLPTSPHPAPLPSPPAAMSSAPTRLGFSTPTPAPARWRRSAWCSPAGASFTLPTSSSIRICSPA